MRKKRNQPSKSMIIGAALIVSLVLYVAGVYSGLYASKVIEKRTQDDLASLKNETSVDLEELKAGTEQQISYLEEYISFLERSLRSMQLEQAFVETLSHEEMCAFWGTTMDSLHDELNRYWDILPYRIEEYERTQELTDEYMLLKQQYTQLSIRTWSVAKNRNHKCNSSLVSGLHFYSTDCRECVDQGEELDALKGMLESDGRDVMIFTVDIDSDISIIRFLREHHGIDSTPALLIDDMLLKGRVYEAEEIYRIIG